MEPTQIECEWPMICEMICCQPFKSPDELSDLLTAAPCRPAGSQQQQRVHDRLVDKDCVLDLKVPVLI